METIYIHHPVSEAVKAEMDSCVLALGFFDGVHIGHQEILENARRIAKQKGLTFGVMTFYPHPKTVIQPDEEPMTYLTPLPLKEERFQALGVEKLFVVKFTPEFARLTPEDFVQHYILGLRCRHVIAGFDYHYGCKGKGNMETLAADGRFGVTMVQKVEHGQEKISSTAIRHLLSAGNMKAVPDYLGDFYEVRGVVKQTPLFYRNQFLKVAVDALYRVPIPGVYRIQAEIDGERYDGVCHEISQSGHDTSVLLQLKDGFIDSHQKRISIMWIDFVSGKPQETHQIHHYMEVNRMVI
ncbi:FAD synthetase family protein [Fictibacillus sp. KU28468]|uniref:FAD synthetase family protein n=1 Tax=Fictibacillus sp. KU28468 TaxID=2991053 RepID=UPI00223DE1D5|nr:FAD synthetase family protein [Fictibacillus sp. KU28468]UZJ79362.1 FAD synthetase family protein [Fictibacillus sp. KU28468]